MARILAVSSQVARGHVGLSAITPALQSLGHEVIALPTILLSNHPGHATFAGERIAPELLARMLAALDANGWLAAVDAVLTGYLPSVAHVELACAAVEQVRRRAPLALTFCDPVLGDDPKGLYIAADAAAAIRDKLLPLADVATPNRFELAWLTGLSVDGVADATTAARRLGPAAVIATSIPEGEAALHTLAVTRTTSRSVRVARLADVPNGTGDLLTALYCGFVCANDHAPQASQSTSQPAGEDGRRDILGATVACVQAAIAASAGHDELRLIGLQPWAVAALPVIAHQG